MNQVTASSQYAVISIKKISTLRKKTIGISTIQSSTSKDWTGASLLHTSLILFIFSVGFVISHPLKWTHESALLSLYCLLQTERFARVTWMRTNKRPNNRMVYPYHDIGYSDNKLRYKLVSVLVHSLSSSPLLQTQTMKLMWISIRRKKTWKIMLVMWKAEKCAIDTWKMTLKPLFGSHS